MHEIFYHSKYAFNFIVVCHYFLFYLVDVPFNKVEHPIFKKFFAKHTQRKTQTRTAFADKMNRKFPDSLENMRKAIGNDEIYISFDGATTGKDEKIIGLVVGSLRNPQIGGYLIHLEKAPHGDSNSIYEFVQRGLKVLYPECT